MRNVERLTAQTTYLLTTLSQSHSQATLYTKVRPICLRKFLVVNTCQNGLHLIMHRTIGLPGYNGPLNLTLVRQSISPTLR